jgi:DNA-binding MarR family transcriptional regulator
MPTTTRKPAAKALATHAWLSVVRAYNLCDAVLTQRLAGLGLKLAEHEVLINLLRTPGLSQQQLAKRCFVAKSGVSMLVTRMQKSGLVQRHADAVDARVWLLALTPRGHTLAEKAQAMQDDVVQVMARHSSPQELQGIADAMQRIGAALEGLLDGGVAPRG